MSSSDPTDAQPFHDAMLADQVLTSAGDAQMSGMRWYSWAVGIVLFACGTLLHAFSDKHGSLLNLVVTALFTLACVYAVIRILIDRKNARARLADTSLSAVQRAWLSGHARSCKHGFDADVWIKQTGPEGPRTVIPGRKHVPVSSERLATEEIDLAPQLGSEYAQSARVWFIVILGCVFPLLGIMAMVFAPQSSQAPSTTLPILSLCVLVAAAGCFMAYLGWLPLIRRVIIVAPGSLIYTNFGATMTFSRSNSVCMVFINSDSNWSVATFLRNDRRSATLFIRGTAPLNAFLARWSYPTLTSATAARTPGPS